MKKAIEKTSRNQALCSLLLFSLALLSFLPSLDALEYFRHTEADRTLIGWEMLERMSFIKPHLLGDSHLTKPPLYYVLLAGMFSIVGSPEVWAARLVNVLAASALISVQYIFLRKAGIDSVKSLFSACILLCSGYIFKYSVTSEIDMTFTLFSTTAVYWGYLCFLRKENIQTILITYFFCSLAFLTKGPPVLIFFGCGIAGYWLLTVRRHTNRLYWTTRFTARHLAGALLFFCVIAGWLMLLADKTGWEDLAFQFKTEVFRRFSGDASASERNRSFLFYPRVTLTCILPWTPVLLGYFIPRLRNGKKLKELLTPSELELIKFCLCVLLPSILIFSCASGKASRYMLPVTPFMAILTTFGCFLLKEKMTLKILKITLKTLAGLGLLLAAGSLGFALFKLTLLNGLACFLTLGLTSFWLLRSLKQDKPALFLVPLFAAFITSRMPYALIYSPMRNLERSVKPVAAEFEQLLPEEQPLYILEMQERWMPYYMIKNGKTILRLTPDICKAYKENSSSEERINILLSYRLEKWRLDQIKKTDPSAKLIKLIKTKKTDFAVINIAANKSCGFNLERIFPTSVNQGPEVTEKLIPSPLPAKP